MECGAVYFSVLQCVAVILSSRQPCLSSMTHLRRYSMLQYIAACCRVLQCFAVRCSVLQWILLCLPSHRPSSRSMTPLRCCGVLQCVAVCCSVLQCVAVRCSVLQCVAVCCSVSTFPPALFELHDSSEVGTAQRDFNTQTLLQRWIAEDELTCH